MDTMTTENLTVMRGFADKIGWLESRQKTLAQNIANADTPGYRPMDAVPYDFKDILAMSSTSKLSLASGQTGPTAGPGTPKLENTDVAHMNVNGTAGEAQEPDNKKQRRTYEVAPAGNSVVLEEQLLKMGENYADHRLMTNLYQKNVDMMKLSVR